jgi:carboxylesterase
MISWILGAAIFAAFGVGRWRARSVARQVERRFRRGPDGVIVGAESISLGGSSRAVLMVHGAGDTPQSLTRLAAALNQRGFAVEAPLLPGHGRSLRALAAHSGEEWYVTARASLESLRKRHEWVGVVGLSMGGALAARLAAEFTDLPALVLLSPYLGMPTVERWLTRSSILWGLFAPDVSTAATGSVFDPEARANSRAYGAMNVRALRELLRVASQGRASLPAIKSPTLVIQSRTDNRISGELTRQAFAELGAVDKRLEWIEGAGHVITVDYGWQRVAELTAEWLDAHGSVERSAER